MRPRGRNSRASARRASAASSSARSPTPYPAKDLPNLLVAFERLAAEIPDAELVVIGDGPDMPKLRALRASLPHQDRIICPRRSRTPRASSKGFDVFALSSSKEGLPWVILEASLAEVPIVATSVGPCRS